MRYLYICILLVTTWWAINLALANSHMAWYLSGEWIIASGIPLCIWIITRLYLDIRGIICITNSIIYVFASFCAVLLFHSGEYSYLIRIAHLLLLGTTLWFRL